MGDECFEDNLPPEKRQECELDVLNQTASQINDLENKLLVSCTCHFFHPNNSMKVARLNYQETLTANTNQLKALSNRLGKCVQRSRPYYELCESQAERLAQIQRAAKRYTTAIASLNLAREELAKLEATIAGCRDTSGLEDMNETIFRVSFYRQLCFPTYGIFIC
ncbi:unnamed protein product [Echinostoma caproni]|uniref:SH3 domain protein n=1 Tax=Echinostoma caproni TaxID=27848 RepID=A0A183BB07_9TREM|nr:unnamed protein product [Echinostoma caproni]